MKSVIEILAVTAPALCSLQDLANTKSSKLLKAMVIRRLEQNCKCAAATYNTLIAEHEGQRYRISLQLMTSPKHDYFWRNLSPRRLREMVQIAETEQQIPVILVCNPFVDEALVLYVWEVDPRILLQERNAKHIPDSQTSTTCVRLDGKWIVKGQGAIALNMAANVSKVELGSSEVSLINHVKAQAAQKGADDGAEGAESGLDDSAEEPDDSIDKILAQIEDVLRDDLQVILQGPPGTGKTYTAMRYIRMACDVLSADANKDSVERALRESRFVAGKTKYPVRVLLGKTVAWSLVQFHSSYCYEDFVHGIRAAESADKAGLGFSFQASDRIFGSLCKWALKDRKQRLAILIIDEINRADAAKVFGELIFGLEPDKRDTDIDTPYGPLVIPPNLWIIGTMNSADRSVARMDFALRRRFTFINIPADATALGEYYKEVFAEKPWAKPITDLAFRLYNEVLGLFQRPAEHDRAVWNEDGLDCALGPSFLMLKDPQGRQRTGKGKKAQPAADKLQELLWASLRRAIEFKIMPQLLEYRAEGVKLEESGIEAVYRTLNHAQLFPDAQSEAGDFYRKYRDFFSEVRGRQKAATAPAAAGNALHNDGVKPQPA